MKFELNDEKELPRGNQAGRMVWAKALDKLEQAWHVSETERSQVWLDGSKETGSASEEKPASSEAGGNLFVVSKAEKREFLEQSNQLF